MGGGGEGVLEFCLLNLDPEIQDNRYEDVEQCYGRVTEGGRVRLS